MPLAEHDHFWLEPGKLSSRFNSRAPRGARHQAAIIDQLQRVSIHVPLAEHDLTNSAPRLRRTSFQFTCPSRSTTRLGCRQERTARCFNSRAPRGARQVAQDKAIPVWGFNSRAPRGARPICADMNGVSLYVSIHVPLAEHDRLTA